METQHRLLASLYASERTVHLLQKVPNLRPFLKPNFMSRPDEEASLVKDLESALREKTPNIRGKSVKAEVWPKTLILDGVLS